MRNRTCFTAATIFVAASQLFAQSHGAAVVSSDKGHYNIVSGPVSITIDPTVGGRTVSFKLADYEFLTGKDVHPENYGSTLWPSPQSIWNWPPPAALDNLPYAVVSSGDSILLSSGMDPQTRLQFKKSITAGGSGKLVMTYWMLNESDSNISVAPWEVTRVHKGGTFFFPIGEGGIGRKHFSPAPTQEKDGIVWYKDELKRPDENELSIADGSEGWMAYVLDGRVFAKRFKDTKPRDHAPGEAEISVYVSAVADYVEIETQGKYEPIAPGRANVWRTEWMAADLPKDISASVASGRLVEFVRKLVRTNSALTSD